MPRARSAAAHQKVLDAAVELVCERGMDATSVDAIAQKSGVSKATIYKHWPDKEALLLEMMAEISCIASRPEFDSGNTKADMVAVLSYNPQEQSDVRDRIMPHMMAYSASHPEFGRSWRKTVMEPPRRELTHLIKLGIRRKELAPKIDIDKSLALLLGPLIYWYIFNGKNSNVDFQGLPEAVVDAYWRAFGNESGRK